MMDEKCKKCFCRKCMENAENCADGMCRNCECCAENDFKFGVNRPERCEMWEE